MSDAKSKIARDSFKKVGFDWCELTWHAKDTVRYMRSHRAIIIELPLWISEMPTPLFEELMDFAAARITGRDATKSERLKTWIAEHRRDAA